MQGNTFEAEDRRRKNGEDPEVEKDRGSSLFICRLTGNDD